MASATARRIAGDPAALPDLPDEILEDIFIRLDSTADLARASDAFPTFRRVVSARWFLRRYIARAADFTFSFIPKRNIWRTHDVRDGRVLLSASVSSLVDLVICDPLHRRYVEIPPIPGGLLACVRHIDEVKFEPFLAPASKEEKESSSFRVMCKVVSEIEVVTFIFSSATEKWQHVDSILLTHGHATLFVRHYACNCFYWTHPYRKNVLVLDMREMKFSIGLQFQSLELELLNHAIVELGEGKLGLLTVRGFELELYSWYNGADVQEWRYSKTTTTPNKRRCSILGATEGYVLIVQEAFPAPHMLDKQYFTLKLETMLIERMCTLNATILHHHLHLYATFPPPLSPPSI